VAHRRAEGNGFGGPKVRPRPAAPPSVLTADPIALLREHKAAIIAELTPNAATATGIDNVENDADAVVDHQMPHPTTVGEPSSVLVASLPPKSVEFSGCFGPTACRSIGVCGRVDCVPESIRATVANLVALPANEFAAYAAEVDAAPPDDPHLDHDRSALAWAIAVRAALSPINPYRPPDVPAQEATP
jgi:hypothetical protein